MDYEITGSIAQYASFRMDPGDALWASKGSLLAYDEGVSWRLRWPGGVGGAIKRSFAGEGMSMLWIESTGPGQEVHLCSNQPGHIEPWALESGGVIATRGSFLAACGEVEISVTIARRVGAALFGGAGLFLQRISGRGLVLVHAAGDLVRRELADGETLMVSSGNLAAFSSSIDYSIRGVGGCGKMLFSGEGLFMTHLRGPGIVLLQTLKRSAAARAAAGAAAASGG